MIKSRLSEWEDEHENLLAELLSSHSDEAENKTQKENAHEGKEADHRG
jgi:hypothetical protein